MRLTFIGTGSGRTSLNRFHSSLLFDTNDKNIIVDVGDSISRALLNQNISFNNITDIIISHYHSDHVTGLPSLLTQMIIQHRTEPLKIYTQTELVNSLIAFLQMNNIFIEKLNFDVEIVPFEFDKEFEISEDFKFTPKQNSHITNKHGIDGNELKFISSSFLFKVGKKKMVYTSDVGSSEDLYLFNNNQADIIITEIAHLSFNDIENAATILNPAKIYLTHIDDEMKLKNWHNKLSANEKEKFIIAFDGMIIEF